MAIKTGVCKYCGAAFSYELSWGKGQAPRTCQEHRGQQGIWTKCAVPGCTEYFVKVQGSFSANCKTHRGWVKGKPRSKKVVDKTGHCATCGEAFEKPNGKSRYCCDDHNPWVLDHDERAELLAEFGGRIDWPSKFTRA